MKRLRVCVCPGADRGVGSFGALRLSGRYWAPIWALLVIFGVFTELRAQIFAPEPVQWQDFVKTGAGYPGSQGSTLSRSSAGTGLWDADAISTKWIYGDGWVEFKFNQTDKAVTVGLVTTNANRDWTALPFAIKGALNSTFGFFEGGTQVGPTGLSYSTTDTFRIERSGTRITFKRTKTDGTVVSHTSNTASQGILFVDTSFFNQGAAISNCRYFGATNAEDVLWISNVGSAATYDTGSEGSTIAKTATNAAYDSDAVSSKAMLADGALRFRVGQTNKQLAIGLSTANPDRNYTSLSYGFHANGATMYVVESGVPKASTSYGINDVFTIRRTGNTIAYVRVSSAGTETTLWTTAGASVSPLFVDCSFYSSGAAFTNCQIEGYPLAEVPLFKVNSIFAQYSSTGTTLTVPSGGNIGGAVTELFICGDGNSSYRNDGTIAFSFGSVGSNKEVTGGLAESRNTPNSTSINYGIKGDSNGKAWVVEGGVVKVEIGAYSASNRFEVRRVGGRIEYVMDGEVYRVTPAVAGSLSGAFYFSGLGASANGIQWYNGETDLLWRRMVQSSASWSPASGSTLTRGTAAAGWTADSLGTRQLVGDGYIQWKFASSTKDAMVGLSPSDKGNGNGDLQYAIYANGTNGQIKIWESGGAVGSPFTFDYTDTFRIRRTGTTINYSKISSLGVETPLATGGTPAINPLIVDCALQDPSVQITNCRISFGDQDGDRLDDQWEYGEFGNLSQAGTGVSGDYDGDGIDNLHEFYAGTDPTETYYTSAPTLTLISGNNQFSDPDIFLGQPLVVEVRDPSQAGNPIMANVPVRFFVLSGGGYLSTEYNGPILQNSVGAVTDSSGRARVYYRQPNSHGTTSVIRAQAGGAVTASNVIDFTCHSNLLVAWWRFDEASGTAKDSSPSSPKNDGTITDALREKSFKDFGSLEPDRALRFDGVGDFVTVLHQTSLVFPTSKFSVSAWVRLEAGTDLSSDSTVYPIVSKWTSAASGGFEFSIKGGDSAKGVTFRIVGLGGQTVGIAPTLQEIVPATDQRPKLRDGNPHLVTFTCDTGNVGRLYMDGVEVGTLTNMSGSLTAANVSLFLGKNADGKHFKGLLDDVKILTETLQPQEIVAVFDSDSDGLPDWWEAKYFGNLDATNNPDGDKDLDGVNDGDEYEQGRNPNAAAVTNNNLELIIFTPSHN